MAPCGALIHDPGDVASALAGGLLTAGGGLMEGGGGPLDATGIGAPLGATLNAAGVPVIAAGAGLATKGAVGLGSYAAKHEVQVLQARSEGSAASGKAATEDANGLVDSQAAEHILDGDQAGGGHRFGTGISGKSEFPEGWSDQEIHDAIADVATDPASTTVVQGGRSVVSGTFGGVDIRVVIDNATGRIVTGYPTNLPRNP